MNNIHLLTYILRLCVILLLATATPTSIAGSLVGSLEGEIEASQGQLNWSLPFEVPAGPNGILPGLSLNYVPGNSNGIMGLGFQLGGLSAITRCPTSKKYDGVDGGVQFDSKGPYCIDGQRLLPAGDGSFRTAIESFSKIVSNGDSSWTVYTKDGYILDYGTTTDSKVVSQANNYAVLTWRVNQKRDRFNNAVKFTYNAQSGQGVTDLSSINWSVHELKFNYEDRNDQFAAWQLGDSKMLQQRIGNIEVRTNGQVLRQYQLGYEEVGVSKFSRLKNIALCDGQGNCTPPTTFNWQADTAPVVQQEVAVGTGVTGFASFTVGDLNADGSTDICYLKNGLHCEMGKTPGTGGIRSPTGSVLVWDVPLDDRFNHQESASSLVFIDLNNDTYLDYCIQDMQNIYCGINNQGGGFSAPTVWSKQFNRTQAVRFVDLNNDHRPDICEITPENVQCAHNTNTGFGERFNLLDYGWPVSDGWQDWRQHLGPNHDATVSFIDINGDGLTDLCGAKDEGFVCSLRVSSSFWLIGQSFNAPTLYSTAFGSQWNDEAFSKTFRYGDLNADGLPDACWRSGREYKCAINTGKGFENAQHWTDTNGWTNEGLSHATLMLHDIDSDGRADLCVAPGSQLLCGRNTGAGFTSLQFYAPLRYGEAIVELPGAEKALPRALPIRLTDVNADGNVDICYRGQAGINCGLGTPSEHSLLIGITTAYKNTTQIAYGFLADPDVYAKDNQVTSGLIDVHPNRRVVKRIATSDGVGGMKAVSYFYQGMKYSPADATFRGFRYVTETDETSKRKTVTEYFQDKDLNGRVKQVTASLNGILLQEIANTFLLQTTQKTWFSTSSVSNVLSAITGQSSTKIIILPSQTTETTYDYSSRQILSTQTTNYTKYDAYGNAENITVSSRTPDDSDWNTKTTTSTYWNDSTNWLLGKPKSVAVLHQNALGNISRTTSFDYYANGAVKTETLQPGDPLALTSEFIYDNFGNKFQTTVSGAGVKTRTSSVKYDPNGLYPISQTNALGHTETLTPDTRCGAPKTQIGPNGLATHWEYDSLCQKFKETRADKTTTTWQRAWSQGYSAGYGVDDHSVYTVTETSSGSAPKTVWYDGLGREVRTATKGFSPEPDAAKNIFQDKVYDTRGLLVKATLPYEEGMSPGDNSYWVTSEYDALGRITAQHKPSASGSITTRYAYAGLTSTITDPNGNSKATTTNLADKPASVVEGNGISTITYRYDALGNLRQTDTNGQVVEMGYDARGNKIWLKDPTMGTWQYRYNAFGELTTQTDAKGQETRQDYDVLGRMVQRITADDTANWVYDTAPNGKGKLATESSNSTTTSYAYDKLGRPRATTRQIGNETYVSKLGYDPYSRPAVEVYPDGVQINRHYSASGDLQRITTPKKNIWDYEYLQLEKTLNELTDALLELHRKEQIARNKYIETVREADRIHTAANAIEAQSQAAYSEVASLRNSAANLWVIADIYQRDANTFRDFATQMWQRYGNLTWSYSYASNSGGVYSSDECFDKGWFNHCNYRPQVDIALSLLQSDCANNPNYKGIARCTYGVPNSLNLTDFYNGRAQWLENMAAEERQEATVTNNAAAATQTWAETLHQAALESKAQAEQTYAKAKAEYAILKKITDKITDYTNASDELQQAIAAHNTDEKEILLWAATSHDAAGRLQGEVTGNGLLTRREYDPYSGQLNRISTGIEESKTQPLIRDLSYTYDGADNVLTRGDAISGHQDNYSYDAFDRLTDAVRSTHSGTGGFNHRYSYDLYGNLDYKSDAGNLVYDSSTNRLQSLAKTNGTHKDYRYDANGNMKQAGDNGVTWTAFNQPLEIRNSKTNSLATFLYDANQQRVQQVNGTTGKSETTTYINKAFEVTHNDNGVTDRVTQYKHHIYAGDDVVAIQIRTVKNGKKAPDETRYLHQDALGNVDTITDNKARIIQRISYDPFGKRTVTSGIDPDLKAWTARGFTGHEHLDNLGLIHMNARLYDPEIGRFLSPDTYIQSPGMSQSYNRYAYVMNNPLKYTDPSGHFWHFILGAVITLVTAQSDNKYIRAIGMAAGMALMGGVYGNSLFAGAGSIGNVAAAGFVQGYATTGTLAGAFREGFFSALSAGAAGFIGHGGIFKTLVGQTLAHGVTQGVITQLRGGSFKSGFVGAIIAKGSGQFMDGGIGSPLAIAMRTVTAAVFGGLAAEATGGSFEDGALSAAMTHLFNDEADNLRLLGQGYNSNNVMGGFDEYGDSLVYHPDHYDPSGAALFLLGEVGAVAGGVYALSAVAVSGTVTVSTWVGLGQTADFVAGRWVIVGGVTRLNYAKTALWGPQVRNGRLVIQGWKQYPFSQGASSSVPISRVGWPNGMEKWRGIFGQRQLR